LKVTLPPALALLKVHRVKVARSNSHLWRTYVRECVHAWVRACVGACMRGCVHVNDISFKI